MNASRCRALAGMIGVVLPWATSAHAQQCPQVAVDCASQPNAAACVAAGGPETAIKLLGQLDATDTASSCARSLALKMVFQLSRAHLEECSDIFALQELPAVALNETGLRVGLKLASNIRRVELLGATGVCPVPVFVAADTPSPPVVLSLDAGAHTLRYYVAGSEQGTDVPFDLDAKKELELGYRLKVAAALAGKPLLVDEQPWNGELLAGQHEVTRADEPKCKSVVDAQTPDVSFPEGCAPSTDGWTWGAQARAEITTSGVGGAALVGVLVPWRSGQFSFDPQLGGLFAGNAVGGFLGTYVSWYVAGPFELALGVDGLLARVKPRSETLLGPTVVGGFHPSLQARLRFGRVAVFASGGATFLLASKGVADATQTSYFPLGLGLDWRMTH